MDDMELSDMEKIEQILTHEQVHSMILYPPKRTFYKVIDGKICSDSDGATYYGVGFTRGHQDAPSIIHGSSRSRSIDVLYQDFLKNGEDIINA